MELPPNVRSALAQLVPHWAEQVSACVYLPGGYSNANYRLTYQTKDYVLRLPIRQGATAGTVNELRIRQQLEQQPRIRIASEVASHATLGLLLTEYCPDPVLAEQPADMGDVAAFLNHLLTQMQPLVTHQLYPLGQLVNTWLPQPEAWLKPLLRSLAQARASALPIYQCCHNDLNPWNILVSNTNAIANTSANTQQWITLDWETAMANDPLFDVVTLYEGFCVLPGQSTAMTLSEFSYAVLGQPRSQADLHYTQCLFWLREYAWAEDQLKQQNRTPAIICQAADAKQRLRSLVDKSG